MVGVRAIGLKLAGDVESCSAAPLGISFTAADFQACGTTLSMTTLLKRSSSAGCSEGHFLKIEYEIRSSGDRADDDRDLLMALESSSCVMGVISIEFPDSGGEGEGIQDGRSNS